MRTQRIRDAPQTVVCMFIIEYFCYHFNQVTSVIWPSIADLYTSMCFGQMRFRQRLDLAYRCVHPFIDLSDQDCKLHLLTNKYSPSAFSQYQLNWVNPEYRSKYSGFHLNEININTHLSKLRGRPIVDVEMRKKNSEIAILSNDALGFFRYSGAFEFYLLHFMCKIWIFWRYIFFL